MVKTKYIKKDKLNCTGCGACQNICPMKAISMIRDREGFWYPVVDENLCVSCNKCTSICPVFQSSSSEKQEENQTDIYAAWSLDEEIRNHSTSGGIFSELALTVLANGGVICGAAYDADHRVSHILIENEENLKKLRQSKYVQSDMQNVYKEIVIRLDRGQSLLFCGTPCQCQAVFRYCKKCGIDTAKLYLIDFICRGSNSPKVYEMFLRELEEKYHSTVSRVWFKNKTYGWNRFSTKIEFENGTYYLKDRYHDTFIRGYIEENLYIRPSCTDCRFKGFRRNADITLGDFWGVQLSNLSAESDGGTSMVMIHTEKGKRLWDAISRRVYSTKKTLEEVISGNSCLMSSVQPGKHRDTFMRDLDNMPVIENIERFLKHV